MALEIVKKFDSMVVDKGPASTELWGLIPQNKRRSVNKILKRGTYFDVEYSIKTKDLCIKKHDDIIYSVISYDTGRNYIQRAAVLTVLNPDAIVSYLKLHESNLKQYINMALRQFGKPLSLCDLYYNEIFKHSFFMMQIAGRMFQHDETGPLSANLAGKFLYDVNLNTGITAYLSEFLKFLAITTRELPVSTNGVNVNWIDSSGSNVDSFGTRELDILRQSDGNLLLELPDVDSVNNLIVSDIKIPDLMMPLLRTDLGDVLKNVRNNYVAHSVRPEILDEYFENNLPTDNENVINVVSDIHSRTGKIPFQNKGFNVISGDVSDSLAHDSTLAGVMVIGNHELSDIVTLRNNLDFSIFKSHVKEKFKSDESLSSIKGILKFFDENKLKISNFLSDSSLAMFSEFKNEFWFKMLLFSPSRAWPYLPLGDSNFYNVIQKNMQYRFPNMTILNNDVIIHDGVRYVGLTIPVSLKKRKLGLQTYIHDELVSLLSNDKLMPTVIISHAPLFNELNMLASNSPSYDKNNNCELPGMIDIFNEYNIIGAIHGHHHIPASNGLSKYVYFGYRRLFVVCSIYSKLNIGFELQTLISEYEKRQSLMNKMTLSK